MFYMYKDIDNIIVCNKKKMGGGEVHLRWINKPHLPIVFYCSFINQRLRSITYPVFRLNGKLSNFSGVRFR